ncbi:RluA family pseudouridine synthase [Boudabousia liubingyangii]|uniref:RluA family pseudouridine synthase n=1 Tax=Boudabousia liubingyangii TaxID=1921764 RepID=UPI0009F857C8|nr:RluA family pseudouridine synthase [Boudabousia liubingyangii]
MTEAPAPQTGTQSRRRYEHPAEELPTRLDSLLADLTGITRSAVAKHWDKFEVAVDGKKSRKSATLNPGQTLEFTPFGVPTEPELIVQDHPGLEILHQDDDLVVINKPAGVAAHPAMGYEGPSVIGVLLARGIDPQTSGDSYRRGIVHRLDVGTSGVMVVAKTQSAYENLQAAFKDRQVHKTYRALAHGHFEHPEGLIDAPIGRSKSRDYRMAVRPDGRPAKTRYRVLEKVGMADLLELELLTGRTHQIRVHLSSLHHPCVGDELYGANSRICEKLGLGRQWLHAYQLGFTHPTTGEEMHFTAPIPEELQTAQQTLANLS